MFAETSESMKAEASYPGAVSPPPGDIPHLGNPQDAGRTLGLAVLIGCDILMTIFFAIREYVKVRVTYEILLEDVIHYGVGYHAWEVAPENYSQVLKWLYANSVIYFPTAYFTKITLLLLIGRVFAVKRWVTKSIHIFIVVLLAAHLPVQIIKISNDNIQQTLKLVYKLVDEAWDEKSGQYKIVNSTVSKLDKLNAFLFVVRERADKYSQEKTAYVDTKSTWIRDILREVCRDISSISLADNKPSVEMKALFHVREDLHRQRDLLPHDDEHDTARKHLNVFLSYLDTAFKPADDSLSMLLAERKITYDLLRALFKPNVEVYTTCKGTNASRCLLFTQMEQMKDMSGSKFMYIQTRYLGSDGKTLGEVTSSSSIPIFSGETAIELLTVYPLQYHPEKDIIRK
uniref:Uncharacterized protein n=2 Tax=Bionectria ochroleuca TaxID=29856 RepID=A0A8H7K8Q7_BIOOC